MENSILRTSKFWPRLVVLKSVLHNLILNCPYKLFFVSIMSIIMQNTSIGYYCRIYTLALCVMITSGSSFDWRVMLDLIECKRMQGAAKGQGDTERAGIKMWNQNSEHSSSREFISRYTLVKHVWHSFDILLCSLKFLTAERPAMKAPHLMTWCVVFQ